MKQLVFAMLLGVGLMEAPAQAQYREESGALEQIYESRLRMALNTVFRPTEYSLVVSVDIDRDPKRLADVESEMDKMALPGVPGLAATDNFNVSNKLHELKNRIDVHLVIDEAVSKEKEETARALAKMKLHLDESTGDTLTVVRALLVPKDVQPKADLLPELSWRMWLLVVIVTLLAAGALALLFLRKRRSEQEMQIKHDAAPPEAHEDGEEAAPEAPAEPIVKPMPAFDESMVDRDLVELYERKRALLELATKFPEASSKALSEIFDKGQEEPVLLVCEALGWETSKGLFSGISHRTWAKLGALTAARTAQPDAKTVLKAVDLCHRAVIGKYLELTDGDDKNPFAFVAKLPPTEQSKLLREESPQNIAMICVFLEDAQKAELLDSLSEDSQQAALLHLSKLKEIPYESVRFVAEGLRKRLKTQQENPSILFDGQRYLLELLNRLDVESEARFLEKLATDEPQEAEALRRVRLFFDDVTFMPEDYVGEAAGGTDLRTLTLSLFGANEDVRFHILKSLPEKRAKMVEKDLSYMRDVSRKETLAARRVFVKAIQAILTLNGKEPGSYLTGTVESISGQNAA